jgi:hypothetical protein
MKILLPKLQKYYKHFAIALIVAVLIGAIKLSFDVMAADVPPALKPCTEKIAGKLQVVARKTVDGTAYYLLRTDPAKPGYEAPLISLREGICQTLNPRKDGSDVPLDTVIPKALATSLTKDAYKKIIEDSGGKAEFEKGLADEAKASKKPLLMPEYVLNALKSLKVTIPPNVKAFNGTPSINDLTESRE